jgi:hypothetical protein
MVDAIHGISSTYVEISEKYLIGNINSLPRLIALNPKTEQKEIEQKRNDLVVDDIPCMASTIVLT